MDNKDFEQSYKQFRHSKFVQIFVTLGFEVAFIVILVMHPPLRSSIYSNPSLFSLCAVTWVLLLVVFFFILFDIRKMEKIMRNNTALNRLAHLDELTEMPNRYSCDKLLRGYENSPEFDRLGVGLIEIANIEKINEKEGRAAGDKVMHDFAGILVRVAREYGFICRNGGNEFLSVFFACDEKKMDDFLSAVDEQVADYNTQVGNSFIALVKSRALNEKEKVSDFSSLVRIAYDRI